MQGFTYFRNHQQQNNNRRGLLYFIIKYGLTGAVFGTGYVLGVDYMLPHSSPKTATQNKFQLFSNTSSHTSSQTSSYPNLSHTLFGAGFGFLFGSFYGTIKFFAQEEPEILPTRHPS